MSFRWSFFPGKSELPVDPYRPRRRPINPKDSWRAPEHSKLTVDMRREYPRDELGRIIPGRPKELVADLRPEIIRNERQAYLRKLYA